MTTENKQFLAGLYIAISFVLCLCGIETETGDINLYALLFFGANILNGFRLRSKYSRL